MPGCRKFVKTWSEPGSSSLVCSCWSCYYACGPSVSSESSAVFTSYLPPSILQEARYLHSWFHIFDALIIIISFLVDVLARGVVEEVASLVVILRLWRFVKIIEEMGVGASEQMEDLEMRIEQLEKENSGLKTELKTARSTNGGE